MTGFCVIGSEEMNGAEYAYFSLGTNVLLQLLLTDMEVQTLSGPPLESLKILLVPFTHVSNAEWEPWDKNGYFLLPATKIQVLVDPINNLTQKDVSGVGGDILWGSIL